MAHDVIPLVRAPHGRAMPIVIVGHVDHGKSTLVGRLLHDTNSLSDAKVAQLRAMSAKRGLDVEWSFLLDALQVERDQGITVDATQVWFQTLRRRYVIIDAPGHREFLRNTLTGAASADAAILVVDAKIGVSEQTRRHAYLLNLIGLKQVIVAINKMDLVGGDRDRFDDVASEVGEYLAGIGVRPLASIPVSAKHGDNIATASASMPWYRGPSLVEALDAHEPLPPPAQGPLRLPVQDVYRLGDRRAIVGRIESGRLSVGDELRFAPHGATARVASIEAWGRAERQVSAEAGESVAITLDEELFVERGHVASNLDGRPLETSVVIAKVIWLDRQPLVAGRRLSLRLNTARHDVTVDAIERVIDVDTLTDAAADRVDQNGVALLRLRSKRPMLVDSFASSPRTGRGALVDGYRVVGGCIVEQTLVDSVDNTAERRLTSDVRGANGGDSSPVIWLTGLSGAGKSTLATALQRRFTARGLRSHVLDGDELRRGLSSDLDFSTQARSENVRRVAEVSHLFAEAGMTVIVALISPSAADRAHARKIVGGGFREVYVRADLETCRSRDPKGLYARAKAGEVRQFTGISAPYEIPTAPDLVLDTTGASVERSVGALEQFVDTNFGTGRAAKALNPEPEAGRLAKRAAAMLRSSESHARSIAKAVSWRATGSLDTFVVALLITGNTRLAGGVAATELLTKIGLYYLHERVWALLPWGRRRTVELQGR
ncbi:MAG: adenylyl-sulfate kinase [Proteobacteria bacterium]|nr:adenylyl-sulfate kinase [Pseudomonadota bacterium]MBI3498695.1 adenylyl-sulfate kinase [Pseudomonadota bacterium]